MTTQYRDEWWYAKRIASVVGVVALAGIAGGMYGCPKYNVWERTLSGQAELKKAEWNRQIAIKEAEAKREAAKALAEAEVERAKGVAKANQIIGESLKGHDEYLRYLWITNLENGSGRETVYVPTEAGLPILEAGRLHHEPEAKQ